MSNIGIKKGSRRFKPKGAPVRIPTRTPVIIPSSPEQLQADEPIEPEVVEKSAKRSVPVEPTTATQSPSAPVGPKVPLKLVKQTLNAYQMKKRKRTGDMSKEELRRLGQKEANEEQEEMMRQEAQQITHVPQVKLVNGEIIVDESSLWVDRQVDEEEREVVDESEHVKMRRGANRSPRAWTEQETDLLFELLAEYGTDFEAISKLIPGRSRDQVQRKYKSEYRRHPSKVERVFEQ